MSRARRSHSSTLQLFPFLAVLVSALGALVLLLLAINRQVSMQARAAAAQALIEQTTSEEIALADQQKELEHYLGALHTQVDSARADLRTVDQSLIAVDQQVRTDAVHSQAMHLELERLRQARGAAEQKIALLRQEIAAVRAAKDRFASTRPDPDRTFVPVVHPGSNGTARQPIYLECTEQGVVFQPEAAVMPAWLLKTEQGQAALASVVQSLVQYHIARNREKGAPRVNREIEPYPLLLVRPAGASVFYAVRQALDELGIAFGYELVEGDWTFQFPELDPNARALIAQCLERCRDNYVGTDGLRLRQFGGSAQPGTAGGRMALTPNLGRLLGIEPAADGSPGGGGNFADPNSRGSRDYLAPGTSPNSSGPLLEPKGRSTGSVAARGADSESDQELAGAEYQESYGKGSESNAGGQGRSPFQIGTEVDADPNQDRDSPSLAISNRSTRPDHSVPGAADGTIEDLISGASSSAASRPSAIGAPGRIRPMSEETDTLEEIGSLAFPTSSGKIPIARKVEIDCRVNSVHIGNRPVYFGAPNVASLRNGIAAIVPELQKEMATWGPAGMTFRWQPKLLCVVHSGGIEMYYGLRMALIGSSIEIDHVIAAEDELDWKGSLFLGGLDRSE
jgi:hypothetical protein